MRVHSLLRIYEKVDCFVTPSGFMRETLIRQGFDERKVVHIPSFYPLNGAVQPAPGSGEYILYFGRVSREKGLDTLIRAYGRLRNPAPLLIVGGDRDGERGRLEQIAGSVNGGGRVRFEDHKAPEELGRLIDRALFAVVPSLQHDNAPMSILESFAHGKPVVGSNMGGIPEQLAGGCGLLFEVGDVDGLTRQMQAMLDEPDLRADMGARAYQRLGTEFSKERHCDRLLGLFGSLCDGAKTHVRRGAST
jgi:glycosyltransferase involved in cell wall biosynthesis